MDLDTEKIFAASWHLDQTRVVAALAACGLLRPDEFYNLETADGDPVPVREWHLFTQLRTSAYIRLISAGLPVIVSEFGSWVGDADDASDYDDAFHPKILRALFGTETDGEAIRAFRKRPQAVVRTSERVAEVIGAR